MGSKMKTIDYEEFKRTTKKSLIEREDRENWLGAIENGRIGELQTKVELLKRGLWVSEREVDVNGADLIVQKANLLNDLIDIIGAPVAFVQVKNVGPQTDVSIDSRYIYYVDGEEIKFKEEFFLFVYRNDDPNFLVFLTAKDINQLVIDKKCSLYVKKKTKVTYVKFTAARLKRLNKTMSSLENCVEAIHDVLSESEYNRTIGLRHFLGIKPSEEGTEDILNQRYENNYTDNLAEEFYKSKLYLHKLMELYAVWPFVIKDILVEHGSNPEEFVQRIPRLSKDVAAYKKQIIQKWNQHEFQVPSTIEEHKDIVEKLEEAIGDTIEMRKEQFEIATEGTKDE